MRRPGKAVLAAIVLTGYAATAAWAGWKNLQHYPQEISSEDLKAEMKVLQRSVGASDCAYCHVVKPKRDFAAETEKKKITRGMLTLVDKINKDYFTKDALGIKEGEAPKATCFMCHHAKEKPEFKPQGADEEKAAAAFKAEVEKPEHAAMVKAMKELVEKINKELFTGKDAPKATCWMCHRGEAELKLKAPEGE